MSVHDPKHPIWGTIRFLGVTIALIILVNMNAQHFDKGEVATIIGTLLTMFGGEFITRKVTG